MSRTIFTSYKAASVPAPALDVATTGHVLASVAALHERPTSVPELVAAGLRNLAGTGDIQVTATEDGVILSNGRHTERHRVTDPGTPDETPNEDDGIEEAWGRLVGRSLATLRDMHPQAFDGSDQTVRFLSFLPTHLDPFTTLLPRQRRGDGKLGLLMMPWRERQTVVNVLPGSPAERAGMTPGDTVVSIAGQSVEGVSQGRARALLLSSASVDLEVEHAGQRTQVTLAAEPVAARLAIASSHRNVAVIRVTEFRPGAARAVAASLAALRDVMPRVEGVILDLRGNFGGELEEGIALADLFLDAGRIVSTRYPRQPSDNRDVDATPGDIAAGLPMAVLINRGSASASEVVALALAENGRAITVGTPSQGKDSIQLELEPLLPLKVTAGRYLGPRGTSVGGRGVMPDVCTRRTIDGLAPPATSKLNAVRTLASSHDRCEESYEAPTSDIDAAIDVLLGKPPAVTQ